MVRLKDVCRSQNISRLHSTTAAAVCASHVQNEEEDFAYMGAHPLYHPLSRRGLLDTAKLAYDPRCRIADS